MVHRADSISSYSIPYNVQNFLVINAWFIYRTIRLCRLLCIRNKASLRVSDGYLETRLFKNKVMFWGTVYCRIKGLLPIYKHIYMILCVWICNIYSYDKK